MIDLNPPLSDIMFRTNISSESAMKHHEFLRKTIPLILLVLVMMPLPISATDLIEKSHDRIWYDRLADLVEPDWFSASENCLLAATDLPLGSQVSQNPNENAFRNGYLSHRIFDVLFVVLLLLLLWVWWQIQKRNRQLATDLVHRMEMEDELRAKNQELQSANDEINSNYEQIEALSAEVEKSYRELINNNNELMLVKEQLEMAVGGAGAGMWDWYIKTGELLFNKRYAEIHGYSSSELPQDIADWKSRIHPDDWVSVRDLLDAHVEGKVDFYEAEYRIRNNEGGWAWIHDAGKVVRWDELGNPERALGMIQEISGRKQIEFSLKESEQRYREVFDHTSDGIFLIDVGRDGSFRYMDFNPAQRSIMGFPVFEYRGRRPQELFAPQYAREFTANYQRCVEERNSIKYDQVLNLGGQTRHISNTLIPIPDNEGIIYRIIGISQDITERRQNEAAVQAEEKRLRSLLKISQRSFAAYQDILDGVLDEMLSFSESSLGYINFYSEEEGVFKFYAWSSLNMDECHIIEPPKEVRLEETGLWGEAVRQRKPIVVNDYEQEYLYKKGYPSGHVKLVRCIALPVFNDGKIVAVVGMANKEVDYSDLDVRELSNLADALWKMVEIKRAEQALILSEENFSQVFYNNPISMIIISLEDRRILEINRSFEQNIGYRRAAIIGRVFTDIGEWPSLAGVETLFKDLQVSKNSRGREVLHVTPGGKKWLLKTAADIIDFNGKKAALIALEDIMDRRKAEQALISSMALYRGIFTATNNPALLMDINDFTILEANPAAGQLFGYSQEEFRSLDFTRLTDTETEAPIKSIKEDINQTWCNGSSTRRGLARHKDGQLLPVWIYMNIIPIEEQYRVLVVINDLSDEIRYQQEHEKALLYGAQVMKMAAISRISAGVLNEVSQPLGAIKVLADDVIERYAQKDSVDVIEAIETLGKISLQTANISEIVRHMSDLASSQVDRDFVAINLNYAVTESIKILSNQMKDSGIDFEIDLENDLPLIPGNERALEELVINLIVNAMYALDKHHGSKKKILCQTRLEDQLVVLEISDNGPGLDPAIIKRGWDPFESGDLSTEGIELGLAILKSTVAQLGGSISFFNNTWGGATFRAEFPMLNSK